MRTLKKEKLNETWNFSQSSSRFAAAAAARKSLVFLVAKTCLKREQKALAEQTNKQVKNDQAGHIGFCITIWSLFVDLNDFALGFVYVCAIVHLGDNNFVSPSLIISSTRL